MKNHQILIKNAIGATAQQKLELNTGDIVQLDPGTNSENSDFLKRVFYRKSPETNLLYINNQEVNPSKRREDRLVGYLSPQPFLMKDLTVVETVQMWYPDPDDQDHILFEPLLQPTIHTKAGHLSGGELRFLEFLLVIHLPHLLLLLDQPFASVAPLMVERCEEILRHRPHHNAVIINDSRLSDHKWYRKASYKL